jgi:regulator of sigma E protease
MLITILTFVIILGVLVFVHECGHFFAARLFGVKPREFGFGFPPRVWGIYKDKEGKWKQVFGKKEVADAADTVYSINAIPMGGFVNIGEDDINDNGPGSFVSQPIWKRAVILSAGVGMNVVLTAVLIIFGLMIGLPQSLDNLAAGARVSEQKIQIVQILPQTPASEAGLQVGDQIININNKNFTKYTDLIDFVDKNTGKKLDYLIKRGGVEKKYVLTPARNKDTGKGGIGIGIAETGIVKYPFYIAIWEGVKTTVFLTWAIIIAFYELIKNLVLGHGVSADISGPIGIAALSGQVARMGLVYVIQFAALLSVNLAVINFLPFPALDGGRVLFLIIEKIKGSPVKREVEAIIHNTGFALLMVLVVLVTYRDLAKYADRFRLIWERIMG